MVQNRNIIEEKLPILMFVLKVINYLFKPGFFLGGLTGTFSGSVLSAAAAVSVVSATIQ